MLYAGGWSDTARKTHPETQLFLLDDDVYATEAQKLERAQAVLSGTEHNAQARRTQIVESTKKLCPRTKCRPAPEVQLHRMIADLTVETNGNTGEIMSIASEIQAVNNTHEFVNQVIETLNIERSAGLLKIVEAAALSPHWENYVAELRAWLTARSQSVIETTTRNTQTAS